MGSKGEKPATSFPFAFRGVLGMPGERGSRSSGALALLFLRLKLIGDLITPGDRGSLPSIEDVEAETGFFFGPGLRPIPGERGSRLFDSSLSLRMCRWLFAKN